MLYFVGNISKKRFQLGKHIFKVRDHTSKFIYYFRA